MVGTRGGRDLGADRIQFELSGYTWREDLNRRGTRRDDEKEEWTASRDGISTYDSAMKPYSLSDRTQCAAPGIIASFSAHCVGIRQLGPFHFASKR